MKDTDQGTKVTVDATDLRLMINHIGHDVTSTPEVIDASNRAQRETDRAALAATEPASDSGQGEAKRSNLVHWHTPDQERGLDCPEKPDADGNLRGHCVAPELWDTPAAEPQRVTLPEPTPPIVWTAADDEAWRPERITFNDAEYVRAQPPKADAAETDAPHGPTLAAVAHLLRGYFHGAGSEPPRANEFLVIADLLDFGVEREAGGDGHE